MMPLKWHNDFASIGIDFVAVWFINREIIALQEFQLETSVTFAIL
jgi:hypothetical protein